MSPNGYAPTEFIFHHLILIKYDYFHLLPNVVVVVTLFPTKIHENIHMYNTFTVVSPQNDRMYFVSGCQKKPRLIELAAKCH